ncbi:MAG: metallopeptidase TldD-related protein [Myxococcota bacterium]
MIPLIWLAAAPAAEDPSDVLQAEMTRSLEGLALPNAPELYYLRYRLYDIDTVQAHASLGTVVQYAIEPSVSLGVEVRVGNATFDNMNFSGWQNGLARTGLPDTYTPSSLQTAAWRLTDRAYKEAVEQYARKQAQFSPPPDYPGDFLVSEPVVADDGPGAFTTNPMTLIDLVSALSGSLRGDPTLLIGEVHLGHEAGAAWLIDSEGSRVRTPVAEVTLRAIAAARASDGGLVTDQLLVTVRDASALPSQDALERQVKALRDRTVALAKASPLTDEYVGPVVFEDQAARALFRHVLIPQVEGTPSEIPFDSFFGELGGIASKARMGRRVLPPGFTVIADPTSRPDHPGSFQHDAEGTRTGPVTLVRDGIVRDVLRSRVPAKDQAPSNGHARGSVGSRLEGRVAGLRVEPPRNRSRKSLLRKALKIARSYGHDHVMVVRRIQVPGVMRRAGGPWFDSEGASSLPPPVGVFRVHADGREEPLRGVAFASLQRWALRDIVDSGAVSEGSFLAPFAGSVSGLGPTEGLASWIAAPDVLIGEVELVPQSADPRDVPLLPPPPADEPSFHGPQEATQITPRRGASR